MKKLFMAIMLYAAASRAAIVTVSANGTTKSTSGRKCVMYMGTMHCVADDGSAILYATSTNGSTWTAGPQISPGVRPAIAVTSTGQIGVVYLNGAAIEYRYRVGTAWSAPSVVTAMGTEPVIAAAGQRVYIAWNDGNVMVTDFVANAPPATINPVMITPPIPTSTSVLFGRHGIAIAVLARSGSTQPLVRVAFFEKQDCTMSTCTSYFALFTADGPATAPWPATGLDHFGIVGLSVPSATGDSLSMDGESASGDVYVVASVKTTSGSQQTTTLYKQNAWAGGAYQKSQLLTQPSMSSVAASRFGCGSRFRIAVTEYPLSQWNGLGATWYRTGTWSGSSPAWSEPAMSIGNGVYPHALFAGGSSSSFPEVRALFTDTVGSRAVTVPSSGIAVPDCVSRD